MRVELGGDVGVGMRMKVCKDICIDLSMNQGSVRTHLSHVCPPASTRLAAPFLLDHDRTRVPAR